tara:strand:+ start:59043 stop:59387 length:345 start_codon:yes stop_codon:yes gene_type:complete
LAKSEPSELFIKTVALVKAIPKGKVLTYGEAANLADSPGSARYVSYILNSSSKKYGLPWHRVVNSQGKISDHLGRGKQKILLKKEGVIFQSNKLDLAKYLWRPTPSQLRKIFGS